jgi:hypothetical protein
MIRPGALAGETHLTESKQVSWNLNVALDGIY